MNLLKRLKNLWFLSEGKQLVLPEVWVSKNQMDRVMKEPRQAQIIKMKTPVKEFLENNKENE